MKFLTLLVNVAHVVSQSAWLPLNARLQGAAENLLEEGISYNTQCCKTFGVMKIYTAGSKPI